ncbi:MAG: hypothetical protein JNJ58_06600 [Chitinophagaceae bacterium]|nr:hypothetical protein [Chitinophagaceae bacterium]
MNNNMEHLPNEFFDWVQAQAFDDLSVNQKQIILKYCSREEYNDMHHSLMAMHSVQETNSSLGKEARKGRLLEHYDKLYDSNKNLVSKWSVFRQAAAVLLFFFSGWMTHRLMHRPTELPSMATIVRDTLYLAKNTAPVKIFDTIYLTAKESHAAIASKSRKISRQNQSNHIPLSLKEVNPLSGSVSSAADDIHILQPGERHRKLNLQKDNSIQDDTLMDKYSFTTF